MIHALHTPSRRFVQIWFGIALADAILGVWVIRNETMAITGTVMLVSSLTYQLGVLPLEIHRNKKMGSVSTASYGMGIIGTVSYVSSLLFALMAHHWTDVGSRWAGAVGSIIITIQVIHYDRLRLSPEVPFIIWRAFKPQAGEDLGRHTTSQTCKECFAKSCGRVGPFLCPWCRNGIVHYRSTAGCMPTPQKEWREALGFFGRCTRCDRENLYAQRNPYPPGSTCWLWDAEGRWKLVSYEKYVTVLGTDASYVVGADVCGVILRPRKMPPRRFSPEKCGQKILKKKASKVH